jgi:GAF domain-containing protein
LTRLLNRVASDVPIGDVLEEVALLVEREIPAIRCGIWLANPELGVLEHGASPSLPADYLPPGGIRIADGNGGCGTAAARRVPVIDADIETIDHWAAILPVMRRHKIRACWSIPFFGEDTLVAGTISAFAADPLAPTRDELTLLKYSAQLAGIVVDRHRDVQRIRDNAQQFSSELHEKIGQQLVGISCLIAGTGAKIAGSDTSLKAELDEINRLVRDSIVEVRLLANVHVPPDAQSDQKPSPVKRRRKAPTGRRPH